MLYSLEEIQKLFMQKGYTLLDKVYYNNKQYLTFEKDGYLYYNTYNGFIKTNKPKKWGKSNPYSILNLQKYVRDNNIFVTIPNQPYNYDALYMVCSCGNTYCVKWDNFLSHKQYTCPRCGRKRSAQKHIKQEYLDLMAEKGLTPLTEFRNCKNGEYFYTDDGFIVKVALFNIKQGANERDTIFDICNKYTLYNIHLFIEKNYPGVQFVSEAYLGSKKRYNFICRCGRSFDTSWGSFISGNKIRCDYCTHHTSSLCVKTEEWLNEHNIFFTKEKIYSDCVDKSFLRFDYFFPQLNKLLEIDGPQHERPVSFGGVDKEKSMQLFKETIHRDAIKNQYCQQHGIPLLRISYKDFLTEDYKEKLQTFTS